MEIHFVVPQIGFSQLMQLREPELELLEQNKLLIIR
jgi:hypothetical protein